MRPARLRDCLDQDFTLLRAAIVASDRTAPVRSCPRWTVADLAEHVARVYLHKAESIRLGAFPDPWPPKDENPDPVAALEENYAALTAQFAAHRPADHAPTWYPPDQTIGFWIRRMAQETVIHRVDAELAAGLRVGPIPDDLALDGIDEHLKIMIGYGSEEWEQDDDEELAAIMSSADPRPILIHATGAEPRAWQLSTTRECVTVKDVPANGDPAEDLALTVTGAPGPLLRWLWNRADPADRDDPGESADPADSAGKDAAPVSINGDPALLAQFEALKVILTQ